MGNGATMKFIEDLIMQVQVLDSGEIQMRRTDGKRLTPQDRKHARRLADSSRGITVDDVLRIFPGAKVTK
jgi:hypothetical protein